MSPVFLIYICLALICNYIPFTFVGYTPPPKNRVACMNIVLYYHLRTNPSPPPQKKKNRAAYMHVVIYICIAIYVLKLYVKVKKWKFS